MFKVLGITADLRVVWDVIDTPIYRVVDEDGKNIDNAQVRRLGNRCWLHVDDVDGFQILTSVQVRSLLLVKNESFEVGAK